MILAAEDWVIGFEKHWQRGMRWRDCEDRIEWNRIQGIILGRWTMCVVEFVAALKRGEEAMVEWELLCCDGVRPGVGEWNVAFQNNSSSCRWLKTCKKFWLLTREFEFEFEFFYSFLSLFLSSWSGLAFRLFEFRSSLAASEGGEIFSFVLENWLIEESMQHGRI